MKESTAWALFGLIGGLGLLMVTVTWCAMIQSRRHNRFISGVPLFGGILLLIGGLLSPHKLLALLSLLDPGFPMILTSLISLIRPSRKRDDSGSEKQ